MCEYLGLWGLIGVVLCDVEFILVIVFVPSKVVMVELGIRFQTES